MFHALGCIRPPMAKAGPSPIPVIAAGGIIAPRSYKFLKYLAIGRWT